MRIKLAPPDWDALIGGVAEAAWIADRDRKMANAVKITADIVRVFEVLRSKNALFTANPDTLLSDSFAPIWYISLAGFSQKTLANIGEGPKRFGMTQSPGSLITRLTKGTFTDQSVQGGIDARLRQNLESFSRWITDEIDKIFPAGDRDPQRALLYVALILGGRIIGMGQNKGGNDAVDIVKQLLVQGLSDGHRIEIQTSSNSDWELLTSKHNLASAVRLRFDRKLTCEFISGGNRPDIKIYLDDEVIAVGEIKGRKDLSNVWESWMPQVVSHMKTWSGEFPNAARLFFGTLVNSGMIDGKSQKGTKHTGLRELFKTRQLTAVYNLSKVVADDSHAVMAFGDLIKQLSNLLQQTEATA